jgi:hypothetical protein
VLQDLFVFIAVCAYLGVVSPAVSAMTGVQPKLVPFAALGLTLVMILLAVCGGGLEGSCDRLPPLAFW